MVWKNFVPYWSVLGLAIQATRWERSMNDKLLQMATSSAKAASLQTSSSKHKVLASEAQEEALTEEEGASKLNEEASLALEASEKDAALAAAENLETEGLETEIATEEEQVVAHSAKAALDATLVEEATSAAGAETTEAARTEAKARGEEIGIAMCELVPLLDVACDVVGGVATVGLESAAYTLAIEAAAEAEAAVAAQTEEDSELALVADLQAKAAEDTTAAAELKGEAATEEEAAEEERLVAEKKQAEAEALLEKAQAEEELANEENTMSAQQEEQALNLLKDVVVQGVLSFWDAIMASLFGLVSLGFFCVRIASKAFPTVTALWKSSGPSKAARSTLGTDVFYYAARHIVVFGLSIGLYQDVFQDFENNSLQARGGLILRFALTGACIQTLLLHLIPSCLSRTQSWLPVTLDGLRFLISLSLLYVLEILILWVACGKILFESQFLVALDHWQWWIVFLIPYGLHLWWCYQEVPLADSHVPQSINEKRPCDSESVDDGIATETDTLLPTRAAVLTESTEPAPADNSARPLPAVAATISSCCSSLWQDILRLQIPFEILLFSCMLRILTHCLSSIKPLWPTSKDLLWSHRPDWLLPGAIILSVYILSWRMIACCRK